MNSRIETAKNGKAIDKRIDILRQVTTALLTEVKALAPLKTIKLDAGINFNEEVQTFEIYLIESALEKTGGCQTRAARLLKLKHTTLNSKIKRFKIRPGDLSSSPSLESRQNGES